MERLKCYFLFKRKNAVFGKILIENWNEDFERRNYWFGVFEFGQNSLRFELKNIG